MSISLQMAPNVGCQSGKTRCGAPICPRLLQRAYNDGGAPSCLSRKHGSQSRGMDGATLQDLTIEGSA